MIIASYVESSMGGILSLLCALQRARAWCGFATDNA